MQAGGFRPLTGPCGEADVRLEADRAAGGWRWPRRRLCPGLLSFSLANITAPGGAASARGRLGLDRPGPAPHPRPGALPLRGRARDSWITATDYVNQPIDSITLRFNNPIDLSSFDPSKFLIDGQMGQITPTGIEQVGDRTYRIDLPFPLTENGPYNFTLLSNALKDAQGFPLDQNANGIPGEPLADDYSFTLTVDTVPPHVTHQDPAGDVAGTIDHVDVWFSETIDTTTFTTGDVTIVKPDGTTVAATGIQNVGLNRFRISFPAQTLVGVYHVKIGPNVTDLAGNGLDENGNGIGGEPADVYDGTFNLVQVNLGLSNVTVSPTHPLGRRAGDRFLDRPEPDRRCRCWATGPTRSTSRPTTSGTSTTPCSPPSPTPAAWPRTRPTPARRRSSCPASCPATTTSSSAPTWPTRRRRGPTRPTTWPTRGRSRSAFTSSRLTALRPLARSRPPIPADYYAVHVNGGDASASVSTGWPRPGRTNSYVSLGARSRSRQDYDFRAIRDERRQPEPATRADRPCRMAERIMSWSTEPDRRHRTPTA